MGNQVVKSTLDNINSLLQETVSNTLQTNSTEIKNMNLNQQNFIINLTGDCLNVDGSGITALQSMSGEIKYVNQVNSQLTTEIKQSVESIINNAIKQSSDLMQGFLGGAGQMTNVQATLKLQNRVSQLVSTYVNANNLNNIINSTSNIQNQIININCGAGGSVDLSDYEMDQNLIVNVTSATVVSNIMGAIVEDKAVSTLINQLENSASTTQTGLEAFIWVFITAIVCFSAVMIFAGKSITSPAFLLSVGALILVFGGIYFGLAYYYIWPPFTGKWTCSKDTDGKVTGTCEEVASGPFGSKADCEKALTDGTAPCATFWGLSKYTDGTYKTPLSCSQQGDIVSGPYKSSTECKAAIPSLKVWGCRKTESNTCDSPRRCDYFSTRFAGSYDSYANCMAGTS